MIKCEKSCQVQSKRLGYVTAAGPNVQCQWVPGHRRGRNSLEVSSTNKIGLQRKFTDEAFQGLTSGHVHLPSSPPPPPPDAGGGGGERDGDGVEVAEVGDDHEGGLPPHPLLLLLLPLVLLPLAQSHRWQAVCHTGRPGLIISISINKIRMYCHMADIR